MQKPNKFSFFHAQVLVTEGEGKCFDSSEWRMWSRGGWIDFVGGGREFCDMKKFIIANKKVF